MARSAGDLALIYRIIAGPDGRDTDVPPVPIDDVPRVELGTLRIAVAPTLPGFPVATTLRTVVEELAALLGPTCELVDTPALPPIDAEVLFEPAQLALGAVQPGQSSQPLIAYLEALHRRDRFIIAWEQFFAQWDVLLCPPSMVTAFPHCESGAPLNVDGHEESYWTAHAHATWFNYTGHPAIVMPVTLDGDGLPIGVQLVGKRWDESRLLGIAQALSGVTGGFQRPPGY
jgi:amidase